MKTRLALLLLTSIPFVLVAAPEPAQVVERGLHHRVLQRVSRTMLEDGRVIEMTNSYTEIGNCLHYQKDGQWLESKAEFRLFPGGAVADAAPNQLIVLPDIAEEGSIDFLDSSGKRFLSTPRWLAYFDPVTQQSVIVAAVKSCIGQQVEPNVIVWPDAFDDIHAAIRVTYWPWGMEQEVVILESSDALRAGSWGLNENNPVLLEMWSELHESPEPQSTARVAPDGLVDVSLDFGVVQIGSGKAFVLGDEEAEVAVHKTWTKVDGQRQFLIEAVRQAEIEPLLARLPQQARANNPAQRARALAQRKPVQGRAALLAQARSRARPAQSEGSLRAAADRADVQKAAPLLPLPGERAGVRANLSSSKGTSTERASLPNETRTASIRRTGTNLTQGVTIDYSIVQTITNMSFTPGTFLVLGDTTLAGVTTIWGGACIKFTNSPLARLKCTGPIDCRTAPYWPAFFVAWRDDTVGEIINGSDGNPGTNIFAARALELNDTSATAQLHNLRFRNCDKALYLNAGTVELSHSQIGNGIIAVNIGGGSSAWLRNMLVYDLRGSALAIPVGKNLYAENVTFHRLYKFRDSGTVNLTNCLMICVTNNLTWNNAANIQTNISDAGIFQTVGAGSRYLAAGSSCRNAGTTNINSTLRADLKQRTTYPPIVLSGDFLADTTLYPQAQRDTDLPDIGYHADALDYCWGNGLNLSNATLRLAAGVSVAVYGTNGITLRNGAKFISQGTPVNMNHLVRYQAVQEGATNWGPTAGTMSLFKIPYTSTLPEVRFRGTAISLISDALYETLVLDFAGNVISALEFKDCLLRGGFIDLRFWCNNPSALLTVGMTNSLLEFARYEFTQAYGGDPTRLGVHMRNNLVQYGPMGLNNLTNTTTWTIHDNLLDNVVLWCGSSIYITNSHNGYCNTTTLPGTLGGNVTLTTLDYQQGALSRLYYPTNGGSGGLTNLFNVGSRNATNAGLYGFTTTTNQVPETNSVVDIGWHLLAVNAATLQPLDFDGDGVPDVIEDANGNGSYDAAAGETDWKAYNSIYGIGSGPGLVVFTPLR